MGFFEEFGNLLKKYNLEIHTFQVDENVKIMNDRFHLALRKEDIPPAVILFRTTEGDFVPTVFSAITINNEEKNFHFINVKTNEVVDLFPVEKKEEPKVEDKPKKTRKSKKKVEEVKVEEKPQEPAEEEMSPEQAKQVVDTLNKLGDALQMDWDEVPKKPETKKEEVVEDLGDMDTIEEIKKYTYNPEDTFYIIGPMFKKSKCNAKKFREFENKFSDKLVKFNSSVNFLQTLVSPEVFEKGNVKTTSDEGKKVFEQLKNSITNEYNVIICLNGWDKAPEAKKLVEFAKEQGKTIITEDEF